MQPVFADATHTTLVWKEAVSLTIATAITAGANSAVTSLGAKGGGGSSVVVARQNISVVLTGLPRRVNGTGSDTLNHNLPNANMGTG